MGKIHQRAYISEAHFARGFPLILNYQPRTLQIASTGRQCHLWVVRLEVKYSRQVRSIRLLGEKDAPWCQDAGDFSSIESLMAIETSAKLPAAKGIRDSSSALYGTTSIPCCAKFSPASVILGRHPSVA